MCAFCKLCRFCACCNVFIVCGGCSLCEKCELAVGTSCGGLLIPGLHVAIPSSKATTSTLDSCSFSTSAFTEVSPVVSSTLVGKSVNCGTVCDCDAFSPVRVLLLSKVVSGVGFLSGTAAAAVSLLTPRSIGGLISGVALLSGVVVRLSGVGLRSGGRSGLPSGSAFHSGV